MSEHGPTGIDTREDIAGVNWHEVRCSCGWVRKYPWRYRCEFMHEKHQRQEAAIEMERSAS
jgi:hypothetical protein